MGDLTSVVMDKDEFDALCEEFKDIVDLWSGGRATESQIQLLKDAGRVPMIRNGTKTKFVFDRYNISTEICSIIVRGKGRELAERLIEISKKETNMTPLEWEHSKMFNDWTLSVHVPEGSIIGVVSYVNVHKNDYSVWGTVESRVGNKSELIVNRYPNPSEAVDTLGRTIITLMADIIKRVVVLPSAAPDLN